MGSSDLQPVIQVPVNSLFLTDFLDVNPRTLASEPHERNRRPEAVGRSKGMRPLLSGKDFILPELVGHAPNGDLSVSVSSSSVDPTQLGQIFRLAERAEQSSRNFSDLLYAEQQLERRRYCDYLQREPKNDLARSSRLVEREIWESGEPQAEEAFLAWWTRKEERQRTSLLRKANRLANCGITGRRLDCRNHPEEHQFFGSYKCQNRYCRQCGAAIFAELFGKYLGLWPTVKHLLPHPGFRSRGVVVAQLDFTAVNLGRMPMSREIREFNQDIRECFRRALRELGIGSDQYGFLWCDEFGGFDSERESYNTNLHAHGVYVGPYIDQKLLARLWTQIRSEKDGAKVVWIRKQRIDGAPADFFEGERRRFVRALGHALKYTGKHVSRSDGARLADLEIAFHGVRRVHTMGLFYHAELQCQCPCAECGAVCQKSSGHEGEHRCKHHGGDNRCPLCGSDLMFPREAGYVSIVALKKEGRRDLGEVRRQIARERVFNGPRGPDAQQQIG
jgi:hypothetical protein